MDDAAIDAAQAAEQAALAAPGAVHRYAHRYAQLGLPVFPVQGKQPLTPHGFKDASTDPTVIDGWWRRWPTAGVAAPTGQLYDVIDVDGPTGYRSLANMIRENIAPGVDLEDPATYIAARKLLFPTLLGVAVTRRGHHYLIPPNGRGNATAIRPGIDRRGAGGYTVLPPSQLDGDVAWRWAKLPTFGLVTA